jgi:hypothetical protein
MQLSTAISRAKKLTVIGAEIPGTFYTFNNTTAAICRCNGIEIVVPSDVYEDFGAVAAINNVFSANNLSTRLSVSGNVIRFTIANGEQIIINLDQTNSNYSYHAGAPLLSFTSSKNVTGPTTLDSDTNRKSKYQPYGNTSLRFNVSGSNTTIRISTGNYTPTTLCSEIQSKISSGLSGVSSATVSYSTITYRITITVVKSSTFTSMSLSSSNSTISSYIGLANTITVSNNTTFTGTMDKALDIDGPQVLYIRSTTIGTNMRYKPANNVICKIGCPSTAKGGIIFYSDVKNELCLAQSTTFSSFDFTLTDHLGGYINLNGQSWSLALAIEI